MKKSLKPLLLLCLLALFALLFSACAGMQRQSLVSSYIDQQVDSYEFSTEFSRLWAESRSLLFNRGYQVRDSGNGYTVETEWAPTQSGYMRRYLVTGYPLSTGKSRIQFDYNESDPNYPGGTQRSGRDLELVRLLIQQLEPQSWSQINSDANAYADANMPKK